MTRRRVHALLTAPVLAVTLLAGCGSHVDTSLPEIPHSTVLVDRESQSQIDNSWGRYMIVIGNGTETAQALTNRMRRVLEADGWKTHPQQRPPHSILAKSSAPESIEFGPALRGMRAYVPTGPRRMLSHTPGPKHRKVLVAIR
jgi:hypothetical protein